MTASGCGVSGRIVLSSSKFTSEPAARQHCLSISFSSVWFRSGGCSISSVTSKDSASYSKRVSHVTGLYTCYTKTSCIVYNNTYTMGYKNTRYIHEIGEFFQSMEQNENKTAKLHKQLNSTLCTTIVRVQYSPQPQISTATKENGSKTCHHFAWM